MKEKEAAVRTAVAGGKKKRSKKLRVLALCAAGIFAAALVLVLLHFYYCPLNYLWTKFSNPDIPPRQAGELRVHFIDVGQGDAIVAELPDGKSMIVDAGGEVYASRSSLLRYVNALGIKKFDYLILSHPDEDHAGGMDDVLACYGAEKAFIPYIVSFGADSSYADFLDRLSREGCDTEISNTYDAVLSEQADAFYYFMILSPFESGVEGSYYDAANQDGATDTDVNNASAVVWLEYAGRSVLLTGDIGEEVEEKLVSDYEMLGTSLFEREYLTSWGERVTLAPALEGLDFLKVSHHGSASSSSSAFLRLTSPEAAFVSVGAGNSYGHPAQETVGRLNEVGARIYRTDESGSIVLTIRSDGTYNIQTIGRN